jgi:hypothetical protein
MDRAERKALGCPSTFDHAGESFRFWLIPLPKELRNSTAKQKSGAALIIKIGAKAK